MTSTNHVSNRVSLSGHCSGFGTPMRETAAGGTADVAFVVTAAFHRPFAAASDFARRHLPAIAEAAQRGFITTRDATGGFGGPWQATVAGERAFDL